MTPELRKLLRHCRDGLRLAESTSIDAVDSAGLIGRLDEALDKTWRPGLHKPVTRIIPLTHHEAIIAALQIADMIDDDNRAVVMVRGYGDDFEAWSAVYLDDYDVAEMIADDSWFSDYEDPQLWVSTEWGGP
jgi:hypothetical protein